LEREERCWHAAVVAGVGALRAVRSGHLVDVRSGIPSTRWRSPVCRNRQSAGLAPLEVRTGPAPCVPRAMQGARLIGAGFASPRESRGAQARRWRTGRLCRISCAVGRRWTGSPITARSHGRWPHRRSPRSPSGPRRALRAGS
jgi:hypothetical protein